MKILKIVLQNINSLKSETPIVIDFENQQFKDVGLYAITGVTGAGKTTILDAITIALYHNIPRFNGTKGTLTDVVSHGANDAFSCVTFENNNFIYEGYWGIRLANKAGVLLKNPIETVSLKNLSTEKIIATQKRKYIEEVENVTQLDYNQFLRSVMLAQGEFASFLSAKGPEKGKLLEQITGEQIYKKIGEEILNRKSSEEKKLATIKAKINADDILSKEEKEELSEKSTILTTDIAKNEQEIAKITAVINWYINYQKLLDKDVVLEKETEKLSLFIDNYKQELNLLSLHEKASPFKELIQDFKRNEKNNIDKTNQKKILEDDLIKLTPKIENLENQVKNETTALENTDKEFKIWLPKFDEITKLDAQLRNEIDITFQSSEKLKELKVEISNFETKKNKLKSELEKIKVNIKIDENKLHQNKFLLEVKNHISSWNSDLITLKSYEKTLKENAFFIDGKNEEVKKTKTSLKEKTDFLSKENIEIEKLEKEILAVNTTLSKNNSTDLFAKQKQLATSENNWKEFKSLSEEIAKNDKEQTEKIAQKATLSTELINCKLEIEKFETAISKQEIAVKDAEKILNLEKSIANYQADRQKLKKGEPCGLCGSEEHPFAENLEVIGISESEKIVVERKNSLRNLEESKVALKIKETQLNTNIEALETQLNSILEDVKKLKIKASELPISSDLTNITEINIALNSISEELKVLDKNLKIAQELQIDKDRLSKIIELKKNEINTLKTAVATLTEKNKNATAEITSKEKITDELTITYSKLENTLKTKLTEFKYELPAINQADLFIETIEKSVAEYSKIQQNLEALKSEEKVNNLDLENTKKQVENYTKTQNEFLQKKSASENNTKLLKEQRNSILPSEITVENKRENLQLRCKEASKKLEESKKDTQKILEEKSIKEALKVKNNQDLKVLSEEIENLNVEFNKQLKNSDFESKEAIENGLLSKEDVLKFSENKEKINKKQVELKTLKEENIKAKEVLNTARNFEISKEDSKLKLADFQQKNKDFLTEKGEISEAFRKDKEIQDRNQDICQKIDAQTAICNVWKELFKIIGNSKDAFNIYVQRLTLKHLLDLANVHLYKLNKRYSLKMEDLYKPKEELNFNLIDHYQTDQARLVDTSSGGEKFIISLALALGLSDLASKNVKIDSLFIDEGFGTLDSNTLETVISTLETLQAQGKMIGIISHVENLKERIPTQIQITKKSNGVSVLDVV
ncbi:AAA family ATPase [Tenacibaculum finnmarkense genomovar finnmarkense]|uniref:AAA family ATPase n=1 Tax=Tenacibaculum finnmarkense TaxID=2781243 RepID=UPI001E3B3898|nr:AAA family ATPase [Tenacibaculum finnmarkense]MCD8416997.1 AAA family ATPase [Tenacibaculum finnmarkense genomovar finnmarkense]MCG8184610.1 AAA family ATPase [Tenacibaculum finnmarkense genomovar finnmarkense]MCG8208684.1 AAA family ATPase [Tenacibaculum finnmarkense genomovar finnmarkense]MCG8211415.1 AAA family ATPase [Tenacibaculum finnmarkense genomovar finnmarkense]MCG8219515.1 AAA family ATPase [Tenacibaculum finnmarkense genomovar finnmarkense]